MCIYFSSTWNIYSFPNPLRPRKRINISCRAQTSTLNLRATGHMGKLSRTVSAPFISAHNVCPGRVPLHSLHLPPGPLFPVLSPAGSFSPAKPELRCHLAVASRVPRHQPSSLAWCHVCFLPNGMSL